MTERTLSELVQGWFSGEEFPTSAEIEAWFREGGKK